MATSGKDARAAREAKLDALHERLTGAVEQLVSGEDWGLLHEQVTGWVTQPEWLAWS